MTARKSLDDICSELRFRICSGQLSGGDILVEEELAQEFSLSRTPIRQVLHRLALEHFVETRSGVGTIIVPVDRFDLPRDIAVYSDLLMVFMMRAKHQIAQDDEFELSGLTTIVQRLQVSDAAEVIWGYFDRTCRMIGRQIDHDLISDTVVLLGSRIFRHVMSLVQDGSRAELVEFIISEHDSMARSGTAKDLLMARYSMLPDLEKLLQSPRLDATG